MNSSAENISWIFIPLPSEAVFKIRAWIHRLATSKEADDTLAKNCEEIVEEAFLTHKLSYNSDKYGEIRMNELRTLLGSDGICVPEHCFIDPPDALTRVQEPLRPFIRNA
ncbi:MAG: hypothetical protein LCH89_21015 [Proteobacteria bacterium]|nr:hypothetical protein [Pseudomonadota bacterium]